MIVENPAELVAAQTSGNIPRTVVVLGSQGLGDNTVTAQNLTQCNDGEESSYMFLYMICAMNMSMSKEEMIGVLCDYISTIHDAGALE